MRLIFVALLWIGTFSASNKLILCCMMMRFVPAVRSQFNVSKNAIVRRKKKKTIYVFSKALVIWSFISFLRVLVRSPAGTTVACLCSFTRYHFTCLQRSLNRWNYTIYCPYLVFMFKNGISGPFGPHNTSTAPLYAMALYSHFPFAFQFTESGVHSTLTTTHKPSPSPSQLVLWVNRSSTHTTQHSTHKFTAFPFINKVVSYLPFIMVTKDKHRQQQKKKTNEKKSIPKQDILLLVAWAQFVFYKNRFLFIAVCNKYILRPFVEQQT